uniref:Uncharacterized protein n=1 Tax=Romanomermis culicivorax TaxID=13658 RepID=A0A915IUU2_ROMCU
MMPAPRNLMRPMQQSVHVQNIGDHPLRPHLQMCSFYGCCTHKDASFQVQRPNSTGPSNTAPTDTSRCYFCRTRVHQTDQCNRPCHCCHQIRVHRATACPNWNLMMPDSSYITNVMGAVWSTDLAKKYPHLSWVLLNEWF